jgi:hypothetical protein
MAATKKVFDVAKPGKTPAPQTARPVIVGHKSQAADPMVTTPADDAPSGEAVKTAPILAGKGKTIVPIAHEESAAAVPEVTKPEKAADKPPETADDIPTEAPAKPTPTKAEPPTPPAEPTKAADKQSAPAPPITEPEPDAAQPLKEVDPEKAKADKEKEQEEKERAKREKIEQLIADKKYFVQIGQVKRRRNNNVVAIILIILLLGCVGAYLAVDAGLIKTSVQLPLDLIKN